MPQQVNDVNIHIFLSFCRRSLLTQLLQQHSFCDTSKASPFWHAFILFSGLRC